MPCKNEGCKASLALTYYGVDTRNQFSQRAPALFLLPGIVAGLILAREAPAHPTALFCAIVLALLSWWLARQEQSRLWFLTFVVSSTLGFWCYGTARLPADPPPEFLGLPPREARLHLKIVRVLQPENQFGHSTGIARVLHAGQTSRIEKHQLIFYRLSKRDTATLEVMRGLTIQTTGVLQPIPPGVASDSFEGYLKETGIHYTLGQTSRTTMLKEAPLLKRLFHFTNLRFQHILRLGEPPGSGLSQIYIAMLLGEKNQLSSKQKERFRLTGTMHLFAISGLHVGVVAGVIWQMLLLCRLPSRLTAWFGLPLLYFYVEVTGAAPSAVRAFLMVAFFWASLAVQRQRTPIAALAASAVFVLLIQPLQLWQMGFQLSYLVVISILMFGLPLRATLWDLLRPNKYLPTADWTAYHKAKFWFLDTLLLLFVISFAAWLASAPLSAGFFGFIAPYAILINILLVNLAALVISTGVIALTIASFGAEGLSLFLNHSAWLGLSLMDALVRINVEMPWVVIECPDFPKLISYLGLLAYVASVAASEYIKNRAVRFALPPVIILTTLALGLFQPGI